jgi:3-oxoacyl-[acyl-carrier protein] reductase
LDGKVAVVTGGSSGIGRAIAERFGAEGARVVIAARRRALLRRVGARIGADAIRADVTREADVRSLVRRTIGRHGRIDILVNNAGIGGAFARVERTSRRQWERVLATNLTGAFLCSREVFPHMRRAGGGEIVMISSVAGKEAWEGTGTYSASKFGLMGLAGALLDEGLRHGIRVSCLCPGMVDTPLIGRGERGLIDPRDIAATALYLVTLGRNALVREVRVDRRAALMD